LRIEQSSTLNLPVQCVEVELTNRRRLPRELADPAICRDRQRLIQHSRPRVADIQPTGRRHHAEAHRRCKCRKPHATILGLSRSPFCQLSVNFSAAAPSSYKFTAVSRRKGVRGAASRGSGWQVSDRMIRLRMFKNLLGDSMKLNVLAACGLGLILSTAAHAETTGAAAFAKLQTLAGAWADPSDTNPADKVSFQSASGGTIVSENEADMLTVYYIDGD